MDEVSIPPASSVAGTITAPASKSYAQRAIVIAALAEGTSTLRNLTLCNDTKAVLEAVRNMGAGVELEGTTCRITGPMKPAKGIKINIGESGLATRLFIPVASLYGHEITITGHGSILGRPLGAIEEPMEELGVKVSGRGEKLPVTVRGPLKGGETSIDGSTGSQFLSGLLVALPLASENSELEVSELRSTPYIDMTIKTIEAFGVEVENEYYETFFVYGGQSYTPTDYSIEGDWSGASCLLVAGATAGDEEQGVTVRNLQTDSLQADMEIMTALQKAGVRMEIGDGTVTTYRSKTHGFTFDATHCPDLFPALVALAASSEGVTVLKGASRLEHKESNRAESLAEVFGAMGIEIDLEEEDTMRIYGGEIKGGITLDSYNDHRIAMAIATAALNADKPVTIKRAEAVGKSYCGFWEDMKSLTK